MKVGDIVSSIIFISVGIVFLINSLVFPKEISNAPGPGFYPSIISLILIVLGVIIFIQSLVLKREQKVEISFKSKPVVFVYKVILITFFYVVLLPFIGFYVTTFLFLALMMYIMGFKNRKFLVIIPIGITLFLVFIFQTLFHIPLPSQSIF